MDRLVRINESIHRELSRLISEEVETPGSLATITKVEVTPDLKEARIWVSVLPESESGRVVKILQNRAFHFHQELNKRVKLRIVPKLLFLADDTAVKTKEMEELLDSIKEY